MFQGKLKAVTFSYDDGVLQDERVIQILNKYGLKGTFNLNSGLLGKEGALNICGKVVDHTKFWPEQIKTIYSGHEVAAHTLTHVTLPMQEEQEVIRQVEEDRKRLSELVGYEVCGMAYPNGGINNDDRVAEIIRRNTGIQYARTITSTYLFDMPDNLYRYNPTIYHREWDKLQELVEEFLVLKPERPALLYIWGHSYEYDYEDSWGKFEELCKTLSGRSDIFYGTNHEIFSAYSMAEKD